MRLTPWTPVLATPTGLRVGLTRPLTLRGLSHAESAFIASLEGGRQTGTAERAEHSEPWTALEAHGAVTHEGSPPALRVRGAGAVTFELARHLAHRGAALSLVPTVGSVSRARDRLAGAVPRVTFINDEAPVAADVVISYGPPVDLTLPLMATDAPHLLVMCDDESARVGPFVVPGRGPCGMCAAMHRVQADPSWRDVALQCAARAPRMEPMVEQMTASIAAACAWSAGLGRPVREWWIDGDGARPVPALRAHPDCRCGAYGVVGDDAAARRAAMPG